ncbi:cation:H+ antiporter [Rubricella aquisinus]|uniref:Cation:H+ antiporter n=1 Tax=Rubricella aquisinus TaxID=2028108 RepID=A0A840WP25_9RHOB|nr:sodium:calcium antiporter [Rubricella aquisinus]MBB5515833.1 cation:H+ antiporter [Rubricella aquisinus]
MTFVLIAVGLAALIAGGALLVSSAVSLAARWGLPPAVIGATVVGIGTSLPELLVSVQAALAGSPDIALGNVVGSNTANILLILGVSLVIGGAFRVQADARADLMWMGAAALALLPVFWLGTVDRIAGMIGLAAAAGFVLMAIRRAPDQVPAVPTQGPWRIAGGLLAGIVALVLGADWLITGATVLAREVGLSEAVIGLTVIAIGTSLPELATSITAAIKRQAGIAFGNVIGSNIFNVFGILGATALISPIPVAPRFLTVDLPVMLAATALIAVPALLGWRIGRLFGLGLLVSYAAYIGVGLA